MKIEMKEFRVRLLYLAVGVAIGALVTVYAPGAEAHGGGKDKHNCHKVRVDGEVTDYHFHDAGTNTRAGACEKDEKGNVVHVVEPDCPVCETYKPNVAMQQQLKVA